MLKPNIYSEISIRDDDTSEKKKKKLHGGELHLFKCLIQSFDSDVFQRGSVNVAVGASVASSQLARLRGVAGVSVDCA